MRSDTECDGTRALGLDARRCPWLVCDMSLGARRMLAPRWVMQGAVLFGDAHARGTVGGVRRRCWFLRASRRRGRGRCWRFRGPLDLRRHRCIWHGLATPLADRGDQHLRGVRRYDTDYVLVRDWRHGSGCPDASGSRAQCLGGPGDFLKGVLDALHQRGAKGDDRIQNQTLTHCARYGGAGRIGRAHPAGGERRWDGSFRASIRPDFDCGQAPQRRRNMVCPFRSWRDVAQAGTA